MKRLMLFGTQSWFFLHCSFSCDNRFSEFFEVGVVQDRFSNFPWKNSIFCFSTCKKIWQLAFWYLLVTFLFMCCIPAFIWTSSLPWLSCSYSDRSCFHFWQFPHRVGLCPGRQPWQVSFQSSQGLDCSSPFRSYCKVLALNPLLERIKPSQLQLLFSLAHHAFQWIPRGYPVLGFVRCHIASPIHMLMTCRSYE